MFEVLKTARADKVALPYVRIYKHMEPYSSWDYKVHLQWVSELTGLDLPTLIKLVDRGYQVFTDEEVSVVWLVSNDYYKSLARLIWEG